MICYSLKCENDHSFDSWFQSAEAFEKLLGAGMVNCSVCGVSSVEKAIMAPQVRIKHKKGQKSGPLSAPASPAEQAMAEIRKKVEENSENVGKDFAAEARAIHHGDAPERSIYGEAKMQDAKDLVEDGIRVTPLPWGNKDKVN
ncbi:MAG: DUF1178 family protein [Proteobacteria bacterium]|nr:DUF1178 family protein [Pseudomonadota bacterium]